ncbi:ABC transporter permease [Macrococcus equipercicus]|uniref:ABC transporter permease n=1 Tax=Macrococcus equipercicus TaxID=69967 RepID=A0ABQ6RAI0_9STAP|nr:ABC transporter permease [Macrococcus equipercicus]KAA1040334.1 ABC transporter permease [Macrococcus equipercicus]
MKLSLLWKLVVKNFQALKQIIIPFVLAASVMFGLEYIMLSLMGNDFIKQRHASLPLILKYANIMTTLLAAVFVIYANRFVMKQRKQEFALNMVLGMEKKHIRLILLLEMAVQYVIISVISVAGGYLFGNLIFMVLNRLVKSSGITLMDYPFDFKGMIITLALLAAVMLVLFIINSWILSRQSPVHLMQSKKAGEKKMKKWVIIMLLIIGASALGYGYYIALSAQGVINSLQRIFLAVLVVTIGTYLLFMSLTILILQTLQNIPAIYYHPVRFLSISGLLARMKANAVSLASITMLVTFLIVTIGMSLTTYRGIESNVNSQFKQDYITTVYEYNKDGSAPKTLKAMMADIEDITTIDHFNVKPTMSVCMSNVNGTLKTINQAVAKTNSKNLICAFFVTEQGHNAVTGERLSLKDGQIALSANTQRFNDYRTLTLGKKTYDVVPLKHQYIGGEIAIDAMYIVVKDMPALEQMAEIFTADIGTIMTFNAVSDKKALDKQLDHFRKKYGVQLEEKQETQNRLYEINGGLVFIGLVVSIVLLVGMFLILYYKQIAEGYEDQGNYDIMKKVGLPHALIKKTINTQILFIFLLPISIGVIHTAFASNIIFQLLGLLGIRDHLLFMTSYLSVIAVIMLVYGVMYWITSKIYFGIINAAKTGK